MKPWSQSLCAIDDPGTESVFGLVSEYSGGFRIRLECESTGDPSLSPPYEVWKRFACHVYLERLPADAVEEVWESVWDAWQWSRRAVEVGEREPRSIVLNRVFEPVEEEPFTLSEE